VAASVSGGGGRAHGEGGGGEGRLGDLIRTEKIRTGGKEKRQNCLKKSNCLLDSLLDNYYLRQLRLHFFCSLPVSVSFC